MTRARRSTAALLVALAAACSRTPARLELGGVVSERASGTSPAALARVPIRNGGAQELLLHGVRLDCGCRLASPLPDALAPGDGTTIVVRCRTTSDANTRDLHVISSDPERPDVSVRLVLPDVRKVGVEPPALYFGYVALGASIVRDLALPAAGDAAMPTTTDPALVIEPRPPRPDGSRVARVRFTPREVGLFHAALTIGGAGDAVPVVGVAYRNLIAFPAEVTLPGETTTGAPLAIVLKSVATRPIEITGVEVPPGLVGELQTTTPGKEFRLVIRTRGRLDAGEAAIRLRTNDPDEPSLTIPVRAGAA